ncbi:MAG: carbon-nitrogen hydrolase family protein [Candidatus Obscuribacterales bacterium]|nr:carbon-nitrogen hydrolase family protein [Candidatus Obscuribacterales bacterium]
MIIRVASAQYNICPIDDIDAFSLQVEGLIATAASCDVKLFVLPEYFTCQLLSLTPADLPMSRRIREIAGFKDVYLELLSRLASAHGLYIVGGSIPVVETDDEIYNDSYFFAPSGNIEVQGKIHLTRFEAEDWKMSARTKLKVFETELGKIAVNICYDVEFPELARAQAQGGAQILAVPSCTDDRQGFIRVRYCAQARTIENQIYVIQSSTVGSLPAIPDIALNYGQSSILTPSDFAFPQDGILSEGPINQESLVVADLDLDKLERARTEGTVRPLKDRAAHDTKGIEAEIVTFS